jgi:DNA-directed RNA polymerase subunit N (RpoN/RPB10)
MMRSSQNSTDSNLSEKNVEQFKKEIEKQQRIKLINNSINKEKNCCRKLTLILRRFFMWAYNIE